MAPAMAAPMPAPAWPYCVLFILGTELAGRFAFYGFTGSLVCFFKTLGFHADTATELTSLFGACVYVTPVLGAYVADVDDYVVFDPLLEKGKGKFADKGKPSAKR